MNNTSTIEAVKTILTDFLEKRNLRKTPERFAILEEIYSRNDHFDVERLYHQMKLRKYRVSLATIYNTLDLLMECDLVKKHQFGKSQAEFEHSYSFKQHDHLICEDCGLVEEFCDPRIQEIQNDIDAIFKKEIGNHSLQFYGSCATLASGQKCSHYEKRKTSNNL